MSVFFIFECMEKKNAVKFYNLVEELNLAENSSSVLFEFILVCIIFFSYFLLLSVLHWDSMRLVCFPLNCLLHCTMPLLPVNLFKILFIYFFKSHFKFFSILHKFFRHCTDVIVFLLLICFFVFICCLDTLRVP